MQNVQRTYLPAAGRDWALPFYDPFVNCWEPTAQGEPSSSMRIFTPAIAFSTRDRYLRCVD